MEVSVKAFKARLPLPGLWEDGHPMQRNKLTRLLLRVWRISVLAWHDFWADDCALRATALAYSTLLSIVPLLALAFSLTLAFPGLGDTRDQLQGFIYRYLGTGADPSVIRVIDGFINNIHSGALAGVGTVSLFVVAILTLTAIEQTFNRIWNVEKARGLLDRFTHYLATVVIGPLLISFSLKTFAFSIFQQIDILNIARQNTLARDVLVPFIAAWAAITALYVFMPNRRVKWTSGLAGGFVAAVLFELANRGYRLYALKAITYKTIYGAVGAIPIFLIWIYVVWLVVLLGAEFSYACQFVDIHHRRMLHRSDSQNYREHLALTICAYVVRTFLYGGEAWTVEYASTRFRIPPGMAQAIFRRLANNSIIVSSDKGYVPVRDPETLTAAQVVAAMRTGVDPGNSTRVAAPALEDGCLESVFVDLDQRSAEIFSAISLADLARRIGPAREDSRPVNEKVA